MSYPAIAAAPLGLRSFVQEQATVVCCTGELTSSSSPLLKTCVKGVLPETKRVILDLAHLHRIDSSGLGTIVGLYISARRAGRSLEVINLTPGVRESFGLTNLLGVFETASRLSSSAP